MSTKNKEQILNEHWAIINSKQADPLMLSSEEIGGICDAMEAYASQQQCGLRWVTDGSLPKESGYYVTESEWTEKNGPHIPNDRSDTYFNKEEGKFKDCGPWKVIAWLDESSPCLLEKELAAEQQRSKELESALEEIVNMKIKNDETVLDYAFNRNWHIASNALNNYKAKQ